MLMTLATALLAGMAASSHLDTTVAVRPGVKLDVNNFGGQITVSTWSRNAVRIEAERSDRVRTLVQSGEGTLTVRTVGRLGTPGRAEYRITAPRWMDLKLSGVDTGMSVDGAEGAVSAETVRGDVQIAGGRGFVHVSSIQGSVDVHGAQGRVEVNSVDEGIKVSRVEGEVSAESVNGDIELSDVTSGVVEGASVNGDILYDGTIRSGGRYRFATHNGDVVVVMPARANVAVSVSTFSGDFESTFPVQITESRRGKRFSFVLGSGGADLDLESFQGAIRLQRAGDRARAKKED